MTNDDTLRKKIYMLLSSIVVCVGSVILFLIIYANNWDSMKVLTCVLVSIWMFFVIPSFRYFFMKVKLLPIRQGFLLGYMLGCLWIVFPILFAPYYGFKYYFIKDIQNIL